jgi:hypothetical protein
MKVLVQQGNFVEVPKDFVVCIWAPADGAINNADPYMYGAHSRNMFPTLKSYLKGKPSPIGKIWLYKDEKCDPCVPPKAVLLFVREFNYSPVDKDYVRSALRDLKKKFEKHPNTRFSFPSLPRSPVQMTLDLIEEILGDTEFKVLIRHW